MPSDARRGVSRWTAKMVDRRLHGNEEQRDHDRQNDSEIRKIAILLDAHDIDSLFKEG